MLVMNIDRRASSAITLIEIVIVVAIVLTLAGMTIPAIQRVTHMARRLSCASNLRQIGIAAIAYAGDYNELLPCAERRAPENGDASPTWYCQLPAYVGARDVAHAGKIFQCAAWRDSARTTFTAASPKSLKWNVRLECDGRPRFYRLGTWSDEASVCLMADAKAGETGMGQWGHLVESGIDDTRHRGEVNVLCLDGHSQIIVKRAAGTLWKDALTWVGGLND